MGELALAKETSTLYSNFYFYLLDYIFSERQRWFISCSRLGCEFFYYPILQKRKLSLRSRCTRRATRWLRSRTAISLGSPKGAGPGRLSGCHSELSPVVQREGRAGGGDWGLPSCS